MRLSTAMLPLVGFQIVCAGYFQAVGKPAQAMFLTLSRQVLLLIPAVLILPHFFGLDGVWMSLPVADLGSSVLTGACLLLEFRHLHRATPRPWRRAGRPPWCRKSMRLPAMDHWSFARFGLQ